jgi:hypothetical protein
VRSSTTTAFSITADPVREGGSRRFAGFDERPAVRSAGDSEETQAVSIFTRIASFDNPSKDVAVVSRGDPMGSFLRDCEDSSA